MALDLHNRIIGVLQVRGTSVAEAVRQQVAREAQEAVPQKLFEAAVSQLEAQQLLARKGRDRLALQEPDCPEQDLYAAVERYLQSPDLVEALGLQADRTVLHLSANAARHTAHGQWSIPDFVMASVRTYVIPEFRYLEALSFEVKNREGTNLAAAYEAHAHARFVQRPFVVCPRPLRPVAQYRRSIQAEYATIGIGLIHFDLRLGVDGAPDVGGFEVVTQPVRREPDPRETQVFLDARLPAEKMQRLRTLAQAVVP